MEALLPLGIRSATLVCCRKPDTHEFDTRGPPWVGMWVSDPLRLPPQVHSE